MEMWKKLSIFTILVAAMMIQISEAQLSTNFYDKTCPRLKKIMKDTMAVKFKQASVVAAGTLRVFFHDCIVSGCDASVIIASTGSNKAEKDADDNLSLPGDAFDAVIRGKTAVDKECPNKVSCADILALATKELLVLMGGPSWDVKLGRRDSRVSKASDVPGNLPSVNMTVAQLTSFFTARGFTQREMIALSGGHSAGFAHCNKFMDRIYGRVDSTIDSNYAASLRQVCPQKNLDPTVVANLDTTTSTKFDNVYFQNLQRKMGLLRSDQVLNVDSNTKKVVNAFAANNTLFFQEFSRAMDKLSVFKVKTGTQGEIRKNCGVINLLRNALPNSAENKSVVLFQHFLPHCTHAVNFDPKNCIAHVRYRVVLSIR